MSQHGRVHPRRLGWFATSALAMGGSNQSLFLMAALVAGQGDIPGQGTAAVPLLIVGLALGWAALPGWTELILMWPNRVGGIAATCGEAFRPYAPVLGNLTGMSYWWGWIPTCGLTALFSASAISQWFLPGVSVPALATLIVVVFVGVNLLGVEWAGRIASVIATASALLAFASALIPIFAGTVDWSQAMSFQLETPFPGAFGAVTSAMAGLYLVGFAAPAFEAAACHVGETVDPNRNVPRAMYASAGMATVYFLVLPIVWLGAIGPEGLAGDLALTLGPTFAPLLGALGKSAAIAFMMFNMFHGTLAPLTGVARTLSQLSEDGLLPEVFAHRNRSDCPWVAIVFTASIAIAFLWMGDPIWLVAAANFTYLIGIALPSVAVWLLRRDQPHMPRPYRAPKGTIVAGVVAAVVWGLSTIVGFQQFGLPTVILGLAMAYSGAALYAARKWRDQVKAGLPPTARSLHVKLTGAMLLVLILDGAGYYLAVRAVTEVAGQQTALLAVLEDIFVAVAILTITVGLVLPGMIAHSAVQVTRAAERLATGTMADFSRAMRALADGDIDRASARVDFDPVVVTSQDEVGAMARSFNTLQEEIARAAVGLEGAREGLRAARNELTESNITLERRVVERTSELEALHDRLLVAARQAGMAEVAIGVLHNIGNVLNSVNVSASIIDTRLRQSRLDGLHRVVTLLDAHKHDLGRFLQEDEKGRLVREYLVALTAEVERERADVFAELDGLVQNIEHIKQVVASQQSLATGASFLEDMDAATAMEDALRINQAAIDRFGIRVERRCDTRATLVADRHQIAQVLVNLVGNAVRSLGEHPADRVLVVEVAPIQDGRWMLWQVSDSGCGIPAHHMPRIFESGFTTKTGGSGGLGLHTAALSAKLMGGVLRAHSDGVGRGATFSLELPVATVSSRAVLAGEGAV
jgi:signal transduction histidine kinase/amino acid transporter